MMGGSSSQGELHLMHCERQQQCLHLITDTLMAFDGQYDGLCCSILISEWILLPRFHCAKSEHEVLTFLLIDALGLI